MAVTLFSAIRRRIGANIIWLPIAIAFFIINVTSIDDGGTNANARFATLRAMGDEFTFRIDNYVDWTSDWARTPEGHYYSNKAPGPTVVAFPAFFVIDTLLHPLQDNYRDQQGRRQAPRGIHKVAIATLCQLIPFLILSILAINCASPVVTSSASYFLALIATLFGNTAAVLMNSYMGNPFAGMAMMGVAICYLQKRIAWMSFFFGWTVLAEYPAAALTLPFLILVMSDIPTIGWKQLARSVAKGAAVPAFIWCGYHTVAFGGPFSLPFQYEVTDALVGKVSNDGASVWGGIASLIPRWEYIYELLLGPARGILFTQPWVIVIWVGGAFYLRTMENYRLRRLFLFSLGCFSMMLWLNGGFPGWHGGGSPGPRYLSAVLPIFGIFIPAIFGKVPRWGKGILAASILVALIFRGFVYATWILPPPVPLWPYFLDAIRSSKEWIELLVFWGTMVVATFAYWQMAKAQKVFKANAEIL